jgi:hypothetical protein
VILASARMRDSPAMKKRVLAGVLWFFAVAYAWNLIALALGLSEGPGLGLGTIAAFLFAADPAGVVWKGHARQPATTSSAASPAA